MLFQDNGKKFYNKRSTINLGGELISLASPQVMGILNVTPDSFSDGGEHAGAVLDVEADVVARDGAAHRQHRQVGVLFVENGAGGCFHDDEV